MSETNPSSASVGRMPSHARGAHEHRAMDDSQGCPSWFGALRSLAMDAPVRVRVNGDCMAPLVQHGAEVDVGHPGRWYWPGDVVVLLSPDRGLLLHRIIGAYRRRGAWMFLTQGDTADRPDRAVDSTLILGRACGGGCSAILVDIPGRHRFRALSRFVRFALTRGRHALPGCP